VAQEKLRPLAVANVDQVELTAEGFSFRAVVDVPPEFRLPKYRKIPIAEKSVVVDDSQVAQALEGLRQRYAKFEDVPAGEAAAEGDWAQVDFRAECDGKPLSALTSGKLDLEPFSEAREHWLPVGEPELAPGLGRGLIGARAGETRTIPVTFPSDFSVSVLAGKSAVYTVQVKSLRRRQLPPLDADFLGKFGVDSEEALRARLREELTRGAEQAEQARRRQEVARYLLQNTELDLPPSVVQQETELEVRHIVRQAVEEGGTPEQIREQRESILNAAARTATERVKMHYVLSRIADEERIEVTDAEIEARIEELARAYQWPPERVRAALEKRKALDMLRSELRGEKTLERILEYAKLEK